MESTLLQMYLASFHVCQAAAAQQPSTPLEMAASSVLREVFVVRTGNKQIFKVQLTK